MSSAEMSEQMEIKWQPAVKTAYQLYDEDDCKITFIVEDGKRDQFLATIIDLYNAVKGDGEGIENA